MRAARGIENEDNPEDDAGTSRISRAAASLLSPQGNDSIVAGLGGNMGSQTGPFAYFDRTYLINSAKQTRRLKHVSARLSRLATDFERFEAILPIAGEGRADKPALKPGHYAAARSHRAVLQRALEQGHERVLILEDDVVFRDDVADRLTDLLPQLQELPWDIFYLGLHLAEDGEPISANLGRVKRGFHAHAYAVTGRAIPRLLAIIDAAIEEGFNFDCYHDPQLLKVYAKPILAIQEPGYSDIQGRRHNRLDQYFPPFDRKEFFDHCAEAQSWDKPPDRPLIAQAKALHQSGKLAAAQELYEKALQENPEDPDALHFLGLLYFHRGKGAGGVEMMYRAIAARPDCSEFYCNLGLVLGQTERYEEALEVLDHAIELDPDSADAHDNRGNALDFLKRHDEALEAWRRAVSLRPDNAGIHNHLGKGLLRKGEFDQALVEFQEAVRLSPKFADAYNNLGCALNKQQNVEAALAAFRKSLHLNASCPEALNNVGMALLALGDAREASIHLRKAIELRPTYEDAHWNLALALLALGDYDQGWLEYEWRFHTHAGHMPERSFRQPRWNGCNLTGRTLLVSCEQGLGDTIQFVRYAALLADRGIRVVLECQPPLQELLRGVKGPSQIISAGDRFPRFDAHIQLLSVPGILNTRLGDIPADVPYLQPDPQREADWKRRLAGSGFKVGIAWQGSATFHTDATRSIPLAAFAPLAGIDGVRLMSLQKNAGIEQLAEIGDKFAIEQFDPPLDEGTGAFMDTAAVMRNLDLVITSDTSIAHLAGALGVKAWLALRFAADWRWLMDRDDSPWYPTMRLFRQQKRGDWDGVFSRMAVALRDTLAAQQAGEAEPVLVPTAPGELLDRLTILQIKSQRVADPAKLRSIHGELHALTDIRERILPHSEQLDQIVRELRTVNETLWQIEDDIRAADAAKNFGPAFVELSRSVYRTNDRRAQLKRDINMLLGSPIRDEKHYRT
jgi:tetratricopeptide (TPR) repeat protein